jgi:hypothetical protein
MRLRKIDEYKDPFACLDPIVLNPRYTSRKINDRSNKRQPKSRSFDWCSIWFLTKLSRQRNGKYLSMFQSKGGLAHDRRCDCVDLGRDHLFRDRRLSMVDVFYGSFGYLYTNTIDTMGDASMAHTLSKDSRHRHHCQYKHRKQRQFCMF